VYLGEETCTYRLPPPLPPRETVSFVSPTVFNVPGGEAEGNIEETCPKFNVSCELSHKGLVHTTPEEFENGGFTLKTHQMFSFHRAPEEFRNATMTSHFGFVFEENSVREIT